MSTHRLRRWAIIEPTLGILLAVSNHIVFVSFFTSNPHDTYIIIDASFSSHNGENFYSGRPALYVNVTFVESQFPKRGVKIDVSSPKGEGFYTPNALQIIIL